MNITEPFVLKKDVLLIPCAELDEDVRARLTYDEGDYTLSLRKGRAAAQVIDGETAALLALFREPRTLVDAVLDSSRTLGKDPRQWFDELLPHFARLVDNRVLVPAGSDEEKEIEPRYASGAVLSGWEIVRCARFLEDTEIYQVRREGDTAALKIARANTPALRSIFSNEIEILRRLDTPRLIEHGFEDERPYVIMEWLDGVDASVAAEQRRHDRTALLELCTAIANAYVQLHARGVLHVDVHARNIMVGERVALLDFGYSHLAGRKPRTGRAGMYSFYEPELIAAMRRGGRLPAPTEAGEQYSIAALLYLVITGHHYLEFRLDRDEMRQQIETEPPVPFARRGIPPWPEVEEILVRALEKDPAQRHASVAEMAALLAKVHRAAEHESLIDEAQALLDATLQSFSRGGAMAASRFTNPPTASVMFGSAGAAVGLLRIAETRSDPALLALADVWRSRAVAAIGTDGACYNEKGLKRAVLGEVTPYHTESGIHAAAAMVAAAIGDVLAVRRSIRSFLEASKKPCATLDLTLGRSGSLLAAAMLLPICDVNKETVALREFAGETMHAIWSELDAHPPVDQSPPVTYLGMAHGWAGYFYAAMRWCCASGDPLPARLVERLHEYTRLKIEKGRGAYWESITERPVPAMIPGWCNGSAGQVFLFTLAHRMLGGDEWLRLAEQAAWTVWDEPRHVAHLCCGSAGRAYALVSLYKHTGATEWLGRARHLANHAASAAHRTDRPETLYRGRLGIAALIADLASPENARMPFFE